MDGSISPADIDEVVFFITLTVVPTRLDSVSDTVLRTRAGVGLFVSLAVGLIFGVSFDRDGDRVLVAPGTATDVLVVGTVRVFGTSVSEIVGVSIGRAVGLTTEGVGVAVGLAK